MLAGCGGHDYQIGMSDAGNGGTASSANGGSGAALAGAPGSSGFGAGASGGTPEAQGGKADQGIATAGAGGVGAQGGPSGCVLVVDATRGNDSHDGRSWPAALASVGAALQRVSSGCEVWLTGGTYLPGNARTSTFLVPDGVTLRGGFSGNELAESDRSAKNAATILNGDLGVALEPSDNTYHVLTTQGAATLDRLTVTGGNADGSDTADENGGGILAGGPLKLVDVTLSDNRAAVDGGGIFVPFELTVSGGTFQHNSAERNGGAISLHAQLKATIQDSHFEANRGLRGGAVSASAPGLELRDTSFTACEAEFGGALDTDEITTVLVGRSKFDANRAGQGGAIFAVGPLSLVASQVSNTGGTIGSAVVAYSTLLVDGSEFTDNLGAIALLDSGYSCSGILKNSSFSRNHDVAGGGAVSVNGCRLAVNRSDFDSNTGGLAGAIAFQDFIAPGHWLSVQDSTFENNSCQSGGSAIYDWGGNAELTKVRFSANSGGSTIYALQAGSIAIDQSRFLDNLGSEDVAGALTLSSSSGSIVDTEFARNRSPRTGAILLLDGSLYLRNVSVGGNVGDTTGVLSGIAGGLELYGSVTIKSSIFWANQPAEITKATELYNDMPSLTISNSNFTADDAERPYDPRFLDLQVDLRLRKDSPCIDVGDDWQASTVDLAGHARVDVPGVPTCSAGATSCGSVSDIGAYEYIP